MSERKKVAILTLSKANSYGAYLQCYALSRVVKGMGFDVELIDAQLREPRYRFLGSITARLSRWVKSTFQCHLPRYTYHYRDAEALRKSPPKADRYIVGSDQVWNPALSSRFSVESYFFDFLPPCALSISYAASFGVDSPDFGDRRAAVSELLKRFAAVSVREESGRKVCGELFGVEASVVLDPTLLLEDYSELLGRHVAQRRELLYFTLADRVENRAIVEHLSQRESLPVKRIRSRGLDVLISVRRWMRSIASSSFVVTDSFHGLALSIIFRKEFVVVAANVDRLTRIESLLSLIGLEDRLCLDLAKLKCNERIDYDAVEARLSPARERSIRYLLDNL